MHRSSMLWCLPDILKSLYYSPEIRAEFQSERYQMALEHSKIEASALKVY